MLAVRAAMVLLALAVLVALAVGLRGSVLLAHGQGLVDRPRFSSANIEPARRDFRCATVLTLDTEPKLREAGMNLLAGRPRIAVGLLEEGIRHEPENYTAWAGLRLAAAQVDPELSRRAEQRLRELNPRQPLPRTR